MALSDFEKYKSLDVASVTGTPTISHAVPIKITSGDDSTTGDGEIVLDWSNISSEADIGVYDENDNLLDYWIEKFDSTNEVATFHVYRDWVQDGSTQCKVAYGNGPSDQSVVSPTVFDKESSLQSGYSFNESSGDLLDLTSNNNDGTVTGATQGVDGQVGNAYSFDGSDDNINVDGFNKLDGVSAFTGILWVKSANTGVDEPIWGSDEAAGGTDDGLGIRYDSAGYAGDGDNVIKFAVKNKEGDVSSGESAENVQTTSWQFLALTWAAGNAPSLFIDGAETAYTASPNSLSGDLSCPDFWFADGIYSNTWEGKEDQGFFYNIKVSADEIKAKYDASKAIPDFFSQQAAESTGDETIISVSCTDGIALTDTPSRTATLRASAQDGVALSDTDSSLATFLAQVSDGVVTSDSVTSTVGLIVQASDGITTSDQASAVANLVAQMADAVAFNDAANRQATYRPQLADGVTLSDTTTATIVGALIAYCSDGIQLSDTISATMQAVATLFDGVLLSDTTNWGAILQALAADGVTLSDSTSRALKLFAQAADSVVVSDSGQVQANYTVQCQDNVEFLDTISAVMRLAAQVSDGVSFSDAILETSTLPSGRIQISLKAKSSTITFTIQKPGTKFE